MVQRSECLLSDHPNSGTLGIGFVPFGQLPEEIELDQAVEVAYSEDLAWIEEKLRRGLSVLVTGDKILAKYLYRSLRQRLKNVREGKSFPCILLSGRLQENGENPAASKTSSSASPAEPQRISYLDALLSNLKKEILESARHPEVVLVLPHLDLLATTSESGLSPSAREAIAWLYENPLITLLAFQDHSFLLPRVIEEIFPAHREILGIRREKLPQLILRKEARKFHHEHLNTYQLYKYVSGLNCIKLRKVFSHFDRALDYDPAHSEASAQLWRELRDMTLCGELELPTVSLENDIGGYPQVKTLLKEEILELLSAKEATRDERAIRQIEELIPKGIIFSGPPGTGKTYFAKALATAIHATIIIVSGPEIKSKWVGESEANLRRIFSQARRSAPSIIVFDELDSIACARGTYTGSGVEHSLVNQLLTEMDGFRKEELVFVVGTTNFLSSIDPALLRPGRFELHIPIPYPDENDRREILALYAAKFSLPLSPELIEHAVQRTAGYLSLQEGTRFSGDHLYALCRALKRQLVRAGKGNLTEKDLDEALSLRRDTPLAMTDAERRRVAVHEAGHCLLAEALQGADPVTKISIAGGPAGLVGYSVALPESRRLSLTREELLDRICVCLGGRLAEELLLQSISTGAVLDLEQATDLAQDMVEVYGMGESTGHRNYRRLTHPPYQPLKARDLAGETRRQLDLEVQSLLDTQYQGGRRQLELHRAVLESLVDTLLTYHTLSRTQLDRFFQEHSLKKGFYGSH